MGTHSKNNRVLFSTWDILGWWSQDRLTHVDTTNQVGMSNWIFFFCWEISGNFGTWYFYGWWWNFVGEILGKHTGKFREMILLWLGKGSPKWAGSQNWLWRHQHRSQANPFPLPGWVPYFRCCFRELKVRGWHYIRFIDGYIIISG